MLAAASCTTPVNPTPNPEPNPNPNPESKPKPDPMPNPPSGGMNGGNTPTPNPNPPSNGGGMMGDNPNPGNGGGMDNSAQQLAAAKTALTNLLNGQTEKVVLYNDYAKIKDQLVKAYTAAKEISDKSDATLQEVNNAKTTLQSAIDKVANDKRAFDSANQSLVTAYNNLKTALQSKTTSLEGLSENKYSGIKNHVSELFDTGSAITAKTLDPTSGERPTLEKVNEANNGIKKAISPESLKKWKDNADKFNDFEKKPLSKTQLSTRTDSAHNQEQPANWSFAAYSVDLTSNSQNLSNWNFAQRKVWTSETARNNGSTDLVSNPTVPTDVSWIYSLTGQGAKYTLEFTYYGPSTAFLYFPYKLVKASDEVELQYKLNDADPKAIEFKKSSTTQAPASESETSSSTEQRQPAGSTPTAPERRAAESSADSNPTNQENSQSNQAEPEASAMNETPTVDGINVAKVTLTDLKFGSNTIELSVPTTAEEGTSKVAPMIGNMYITSNDQNQRKIYNEIFGNTSNDSTSVTVDLLKGYSLASGWSTYVGEFKRLTGANQTASDSQTSAPSYLVGFIAGSGQRTVNNVSNIIRNPNIAGEQRTLAIYVNAPSDGEYHISGAYLQGSNPARSLKFSTGTSSSNNEVTVTNLKQKNWTTLGHFDTKMTSTTVSGTPMKRTLTLSKGLNKIILWGVSNGDTPFIGNLTFTLESNQTTSEQIEPSSAIAEKNI
ncbi:hypothetical protein F9C22_02410 [Mycoplasmoides gallisepticum]|nr:hypothetical protein F9C22_02410 [Mycoplasmoides gallisepticum]